MVEFDIKAAANQIDHEPLMRAVRTPPGGRPLIHTQWHTRHPPVLSTDSKTRTYNPYSLALPACPGVLIGGV
jgi:hypothetical protein